MTSAHHQPHAERRTAVRASAWVFALVVAILAAIIATSSTQIALQRDESVAAARRGAENFSRVLAAHVQLAVQAVDQFLIGSAIALRMAPGGLDSRSDELFSTLRATHALPNISALVVLDAAGRVVHTDNIELAQPLDQSGGAVFRAHMQSPSAGGPIIHDPIVLTDGRIVLPVSRRLSGPDERFSGVLVALVDSNHFADLFRTLDLGPNGALALIAAGSVVVARWPANPIVGARIQERSGARDAIAQGQTAGAILGRTPIDGERRMVGWQEVAGTQLVVLAAIAEADFLAAWRRDTRTEITRAIIRGLVVVLLGGLFYWQLRRAENANRRLAASEARFRDFAVASSDWYWEQDENLRFTFLSQSCQQFNRMRPDEHYGKTRRETGPLGVSEAQWAQHEADLAARRPFRDFRLQRIDAQGRLRHLTCSGVPVFDDAGVFRGYRGIGRDVSAEVEALQMLQDTLHLLHGVIDAMPGIVNAKGTDGRYILMNAFQARLFGRTPESVIGLVAADLFDKAHAEKTAALERRLIETGEPSGFYQDRFAGSDGVQRDWLTNKLPVKDAQGQVRFILSTSIDISDRVRMEQQLVQAQQLLQAVIDAIPGMINAKDLQGRYVLMSSYQAQLYGTTPADAIGKTAGDLLGPEYGAYTGEIDARVVASGQSTGFYEEQYQTADGVVRDWLTVKLPLLDADGAVRLIITVALDISERKSAERSLLQTQDQLQNARDAAVRASHAKSAFLAHMSHELRTPLNAIIGFSEIMKLGVFGPLGSPRYNEYAGDIFHSAQHLLALINEVLDMAKIEAGKRELELESVRCADEIDEAMRMLEGNAAAGGVTVSVDMADGPPTLRLDRRAFRQVLLNIIGNAVKFTQPGGSVMIRSETRADAVAIVVADDGPGIPEDQLAEIGRPFQQARGSSYTTAGGTGLGLALSRSLVELHGGRLVIESTEGLGTTVTILLPALPAGDEVEEQRSAA